MTQVLKEDITMCFPGSPHCIWKTDKHHSSKTNLTDANTKDEFLSHLQTKSSTTPGERTVLTPGGGTVLTPGGGPLLNTSIDPNDAAGKNPSGW